MSERGYSSHSQPHWYQEPAVDVIAIQLSLDCYGNPLQSLQEANKSNNEGLLLPALHVLELILGMKCENNSIAT